MKGIISMVILIGFIAIFLLSVYYVGYRLAIHFQLAKWYTIISVGLLLIGSMTAIFLAVKNTNPAFSSLVILSGHILIYFFYLLVFLVLFHIVGRYVQLNLKWTGLIAVILASIPVIIGAVKALNFKVKQVDVELMGLESELKIMIISDVHLGHHRRGNYLSRIVDETNKLNPDLVLLPGDLVDSDLGLSNNSLNSLSKLKVPAFYISGNHEKAIEEVKVISQLKQLGIDILTNRVIDTLGLQIIGLDYMKADDKVFDMHPSTNKETIESVLNRLEWNRSQPTIMMHHSPVGIQYASNHEIDLVISGHTHGGQIFPFNFIAGLIFKYNDGLYDYKNTKVFVTHGAGTFFAKSRLGSDNEIVLINLRPKK